MSQHDIAAFIEDVVDLGLNICAIGQRHYVIDDSGVHPGEREAVRNALRLLREQYGDAGHLKDEIVAYLHLIGRVVFI